jgi:DNA invertase Pin-like site-specific DNA recombinase
LPVTHSKITTDHLRLSAALYIRQSTSQQLRDHQESTQRQYQLTHRLTSLGWSHEQIIVIDEDLGVSGSGRQVRVGFRRLLSLITEQKVGIVLGLEMSRLARNSKDWHDLFEVCGVYQVLIADEDGVFETSDPNDRLVLGLKGIISEMELHTMKVRLERGRFNKAERGELFHDVPVGYVKNAEGVPELDPDESAREAIHTFFRRFEQVGSANGLFHHLNEHGIRLPFRDAAGQLTWHLASKSAVGELIKHPLYAGAYGYGRKKRYGGRKPAVTGKKWLPPDQWKVLIKDRFPAYITWEQYEANQRVLRNNDHRANRSGPPRSGGALLVGIVFCGSCRRRLSPQYGSNGRGSYCCGRHRTLAGVPPCHTTILCQTLDDFVAEMRTRKIGTLGTRKIGTQHI